MKKGKIISMPASVEAQIRTRARNLPIGRCYVNEGWDHGQMASVLVTRNHVNGNVTFGSYLVDLSLLGVKDCFYGFNEPPETIADQFLSLPLGFTECDYALAHNIIFEGIAFAEEYGFEPVKEFTKTGIYILEEDSDDIPQMDIPVGHGEDEIPTVFTTPDNDMKREMAILDKTAGKGNYRVIFMDGSEYDFGDDDDDDEDYDDDDEDYDDEDYDDDDDSYIDVLSDIVDTGLDKYVEQFVHPSAMQALVMTDLLYGSKFDTPELQKPVDEISELIFEDSRFNPDYERHPELEKYMEQMQTIADSTVDDENEALAKIEALSAAHPDDPYLGIAHIIMLRVLELKPEIERVTRYWYDRAGDHYAIRLTYAEFLIRQERYEEVFELFGNKPGLDALTTDNDAIFTSNMVASFCACYVLAWLSRDEQDKAESYYRTMVEFDGRTEIVSLAMQGMMKRKLEKLNELCGEES